MCAPCRPLSERSWASPATTSQAAGASFDRALPLLLSREANGRPQSQDAFCSDPLLCTQHSPSRNSKCASLSSRQPCRAAKRHATTRRWETCMPCPIPIHLCCFLILLLPASPLPVHHRHKQARRQIRPNWTSCEPAAAVETARLRCILHRRHPSSACRQQSADHAAKFLPPRRPRL